MLKSDIRIGNYYKVVTAAESNGLRNEVMKPYLDRVAAVTELGDHVPFGKPCIKLKDIPLRFYPDELTTPTFHPKHAPTHTVLHNNNVRTPMVVDVRPVIKIIDASEIFTYDEATYNGN